MIVGLDRKSLDQLEHRALSKKPVKLRPRDAASVLVLDRSGTDIRILMGKRRDDLAFMPGQFVFPGGRTDRDDCRIRPVAPLAPHVARQLAGGIGRGGEKRAETIALSALRECYEETGLLIGASVEDAPGRNWPAFAALGIAPALDGMAYIARAITPPGRVRRFDSRFFAVWREAVACEAPDGPPEQEFSEIVWVTFAQTAGLDLPGITRTIIEELRQRLEADPDLAAVHGVAEFRMRGNTFVREVRV